MTNERLFDIRNSQFTENNSNRGVMESRVQKIKQKFLDVYGDAGGGRRLAVVRAPGRVNIIGEHTDYNEGYVMPMAVDRDILVAAQRRTDRMFSVYSMDFDEKIQVPLATLKYHSEDGWANYAKGVIWALLGAGHKLEGYNMVLEGNLPQGAGLASSAALELAVACAATVLGDWPWDPVSMAKLCQRAENQFMSVNCGIMDQLAVAAGKAGHALFLDCRSLEFENIPVNFQDAQFVVVHSGVSRGLKNSEYNTRREECEAACKALKEKNPKYLSLRDVGVVAFERHKSVLPGKLRARAEHVVYENDRVLKARQALASGDAKALGALMVKSHRSLQKLYQVSCDEIDTLVEIAMQLEGVLGARLTGAGFGGCTVNLVAKDKVETFMDQLSRQYKKVTNLKAMMIPCEPSDAVKEIEGD